MDLTLCLQFPFRLKIDTVGNFFAGFFANGKDISYKNLAKIPPAPPILGSKAINQTEPERNVFKGSRKNNSNKLMSNRNREAGFLNLEPAARTEVAGSKNRGFGVNRHILRRLVAFGLFLSEPQGKKLSRLRFSSNHVTDIFSSTLT